MLLDKPTCFVALFVRMYLVSSFCEGFDSIQPRQTFICDFFVEATHIERVDTNQMPETFICNLLAAAYV